MSETATQPVSFNGSVYFQQTTDPLHPANCQKYRKAGVYLWKFRIPWRVFIFLAVRGSGRLSAMAMFFCLLMATCFLGIAVADEESMDSASDILYTFFVQITLIVHCLLGTTFLIANAPTFLQSMFMPIDSPHFECARIVSADSFELERVPNAVKRFEFFGMIMFLLTLISLPLFITLKQTGGWSNCVIPDGSTDWVKVSMAVTYTSVTSYGLVLAVIAVACEFQPISSMYCKVIDQEKIAGIIKEFEPFDFGSSEEHEPRVLVRHQKCRYCGGSPR